MALACWQVAALLDRDPAAHASLDDPPNVVGLLRALHQAGATSQVTTLANRAVAHVSLDNPTDDVSGLLWALWEAGATSTAVSIGGLTCGERVRLRPDRGSLGTVSV